MNKLSMSYRKMIREYRDKKLSQSLGKTESHMCKNMDLGKYVKMIVESQAASLLIYTPDSRFNGKKEILFINQKWRNIVAEYDFIQIVPSIPMIDISLEMSDYELYSAIGIACLIAHKSGIQRVLLMSHIPIWVVIENTMDFISMVLKIWNECKERTICNYQSAVFMVHHSQIVCNFQVSIILLSNFHFLKRI
jgi:hypothetical protein